MKIYTRTGDKGSTGLLGGTRVPKDHLRIEAYGTVDELNSHLGLLRDQAPAHLQPRLVALQETLFAIGSRLASQSDAEADRFQVPLVEEADVAAMEAWMDAMDTDLPPTVCRRAERRVVQLSAQEPVPEILVRFLNRLSDLFFVLARHLGRELNVPETPWQPRR
jgi:cob(I)alamin adenosyltransferase